MEVDYISILLCSQYIVHVANMDETQLPSLLHYNDDGIETIRTSLSLAKA